MGLPALKREPRRAARTPRLRLVSPGERAPRTASRTRSSASRAPRTAGRQVFTAFALCMALVAALGVGRVALTAAAAQTSMDSGQLRKQIKAARYEGDMLEVQQSALASPSRIRRLAGTKLSLAEPSSVCYLGVDGRTHCETSTATAAKPAGTPRSPRTSPDKPLPKGGLGELVSRVMDVAAGEAQVLLVGDVGLASSR